MIMSNIEKATLTRGAIFGAAEWMTGGLKFEVAMCVLNCGLAVSPGKELHVFLN